MASRKQIAAVREVLYERKRLREMLDEAASIDVLMNTNPYGELPPDDVRVKPGAGPLWFSPETGAVDRGVVEAADRCLRLAKLLRKTRRELADVRFDAKDKRELRDALDEQALAWIARGNLWRDPGSPDVSRDLAAIVDHERSAAKSYARVKEYLHEPRYGSVE